MNKPLIRAAAVINIVAASLIYVACSGDDGKDGKDGCLVAKNAAGNYDVTCGGTAIGTIPGGAGAGEGCTATPLATGNGISIQCGGGTPYPIYNGADGSGGGAGPCVMTAMEPNIETVYGDKWINIRCTADGRSATIVVCPPGQATGSGAVNNAQQGSTGLLLNTDGGVGRCTEFGTIIRANIRILSCGQATFSPQKEFCQRTIASGADSGRFAIASQSLTDTIVTAGLNPLNDAINYPSQSALIVDAESWYNLAGDAKFTGKVISVIKPLCGIEPAPANTQNNDPDVLNRHRAQTVSSGSVNAWGKPTVYNGLQSCVRNLVIKEGDGHTQYTTASGIKKVAGGAYDLNAGEPTTAAWSVQTNGQCIIDLKLDNGLNSGNSEYYVEDNINGFRFTTGAGVSTGGHYLPRTCSFMGAVTVQQNTASGAVPFTTCPPEKPVVGLDDIVCVDRLESCKYFSTIDNTCLVTGEASSLYGLNTRPSIVHKAATASGVVTVTQYSPASIANPGIYAMDVGNRLGIGTRNAIGGSLDAKGNLWSKACVTESRTNYYAVNDPYLTNKGFRTKLHAASYSNSGEDIEPPQCEEYNADGTVVTGKEKVPFDDAFACLKGTLSLDVPALQIRSIKYDGLNWNSPLYCVQDDYGALPVVAHPITTSPVCLAQGGTWNGTSNKCVKSGLASQAACLSARDNTALETGDWTTGTPGVCDNPTPAQISEANSNAGLNFGQCNALTGSSFVPANAATGTCSIDASTADGTDCGAIETALDLTSGDLWEATTPGLCDNPTSVQISEANSNAGLNFGQCNALTGSSFVPANAATGTCSIDASTADGTECEAIETALDLTSGDLWGATTPEVLSQCVI